MEKGTILFTKDGRKIGNAIVNGSYNKYGFTFYRIKTDFGNAMSLTKEEIDSMFYGFPETEYLKNSISVLDWMFTRARLFFKF